MQCLSVCASVCVSVSKTVAMAPLSCLLFNENFEFFSYKKIRNRIESKTIIHMHQRVCKFYNVLMHYILKPSGLGSAVYADNHCYFKYCIQMCIVCTYGIVLNFYVKVHEK